MATWLHMFRFFYMPNTVSCLVNDRASLMPDHSTQVWGCILEWVKSNSHCPKCRAVDLEDNIHKVAGLCEAQAPLEKFFSVVCLFCLLPWQQLFVCFWRELSFCSNVWCSSYSVSLRILYCCALALFGCRCIFSRHGVTCNSSLTFQWAVKFHGIVAFC